MKRPHYAWYILIVCFLLNMLVQALIMSISNLYVIPMYNDFGVPRSLITLQSTCIMVSAILSAPGWGRLYKAKDAHWLLPFALACTSLTVFLRSFCPNIPTLLLLAFTKGVFFTGSTLLPISILLTSWFQKKRGFAVSCAAIGSSFGGVILSPLVEHLISSFGWRSSDKIMGIVLFLICVPIAWFVIHGKPADLGLRPYGAEELIEAVKGAGPRATAAVSDASNNEIRIVRKKFDVSEAARCPIFYLLVLAVFFMTFANGAALQLPTYLMDIGYAPSFAARAVSAYMAIGIPGKLLLGQIVDRFGIKAAACYNCTIAALAFICFINAENDATLVGIVVFFGLASGISSMIPTLLTARFFGGSSYGPVYGIIISANRLGGGLGTLLVATLFDLTGVYHIIWPLCFLMMILAMTSILLCFQRAKALGR